MTEIIFALAFEKQSPEMFFLKSQWFFLKFCSLTYIILSFLLQSYKITELQPLWICD